MRDGIKAIGLAIVAVCALRGTAVVAAPLSSDAGPATLQSADAMPLKP